MATLSAPPPMRPCFDIVSVLKKPLYILLLYCQGISQQRSFCCWKGCTAYRPRDSSESTHSNIANDISTGLLPSAVICTRLANVGLGRKLCPIVVIARGMSVQTYWCLGFTSTSYEERGGEERGQRGKAACCALPIYRRGHLLVSEHIIIKGMNWGDVSAFIHHPSICPLPPLRHGETVIIRYLQIGFAVYDATKQSIIYVMWHQLRLDIASRDMASNMSTTTHIGPGGSCYQRIGTNDCYCTYLIKVDE